MRVREASQVHGLGAWAAKTIACERDEQAFSVCRPGRHTKSCLCRAGVAGLDAEQRVCRAPAKQCGRDRYNANPAPRRLRPDKHQADQAQAEDNAQRAVNTSYVLVIEKLPVR